MESLAALQYLCLPELDGVGLDGVVALGVPGQGVGRLLAAVGVRGEDGRVGQAAQRDLRGLLAVLVLSRARVRAEVLLAQLRGRKEG